MIALCSDHAGLRNLNPLLRDIWKLKAAILRISALSVQKVAIILILRILVRLRLNRANAIPASLCVALAMGLP